MSLMDNDYLKSIRYHRNKDLINQELLNEITVIGLGSIGSELISQLAIMGWDNIIMYDNDTLERHNLSSTKYYEDYLGSAKARAAEVTARRFNNNCNVTAYRELFKTHSKITPIAIVCTDTMESRATVYKEWKKLSNRKILIDIRMDSLTMQMVTTTMTKDKYNEFFVNDAEIEDAVCTMKHTIFTSSLAAGHAVKQLFLILMNHPYYIYEWHGFSPTASDLKYLTININEEDINEEESSQEIE